MKNIYFLFLAIILFGCTQDPAKEATPQAVDSRPKSQLELLKELETLDSVYNEQINVITKKEAVDTGKVIISNFIFEKLNARAENWEAIVLAIDNNGVSDYVKLMFPKQLEFEEKYPELNAVILEDIYLPENIKNKVKLLAKDDKVLVTGSFVKNNTTNEVEIEPNTGLYDYESPFNNPSFLFHIENIKKVEPKIEK